VPKLGAEFPLSIPEFICPVSSFFSQPNTTTTPLLAVDELASIEFGHDFFDRIGACRGP